MSRWSTYVLSRRPRRYLRSSFDPFVCPWFYSCLGAMVHLHKSLLSRLFFRISLSTNGYRLLSSAYTRFSSMPPKVTTLVRRETGVPPRLMVFPVEVKITSACKSYADHKHWVNIYTHTAAHFYAFSNEANEIVNKYCVTSRFSKHRFSRIQMW